MIMTLLYTLVLIPPLLIVCLWKRRPVWAFLIASLLLFIGWVAPGIIHIFQAMMSYGTADPELMAGRISEAIITTLFAMMMGLPLLALIQWVARRNYRRAQKEKPPKDVFH